jgi:hypothetical protein
MALPHFAVEGDPTCLLRVRGELGQKHGLARAAQTGERPVRMERLLGDKRVWKAINDEGVNRSDSVTEWLRR